MNIQPVAPGTQEPAFLWGQKELPLGPPMPLDSPWVKSLQQLFPRENPQLLSKHAAQLLSNMTRMFSAQIARDVKKAREAAQKMKDAILGRN
jgi:hypothetical protein